MGKLHACVLLASLIIVSSALPASAETWHVYADGSGDAPTIAAAVASASTFDSILVYPGVYWEKDIAVTKQLYIIGVEGYEHTTINPSRTGRCFLFETQTKTTVLKGFTLMEAGFLSGYSTTGGAILCRGRSQVDIIDCYFDWNYAWYGAAAAVLDSSIVTFKRCIFVDNLAIADGEGGAIKLKGADPIDYMLSVVIDSCVFVDNMADMDGGAISLDFCTVEIKNSTFTDNIVSSNPNSGQISLRMSAGITMERSIVVFGQCGVFANEDLLMALFACNDVYGNTNGDYGGWIPDQTGVNYNISLDPLFCGSPYDLSISTTSPCAAANSQCGETIGRFGPGCGPDLTLTGIGFSSTSQPAGTNISAWFREKNAGDLTADIYWFDFFYDRVTSPPPGTRGNFFSRHGPLAAGDSSGVWSMMPITSDTCCVEWRSTFWIDTENEIPETNESNNMAGPFSIFWQPPVQPGWPVSTGSAFHSSPVVASIDHDPSTMEVAIGCDNGDLYVWRHDGTSVPGFPKELPAPVQSSPAVGDIAGGFENEIVVGCDDGYLYAFDHAGEQLWLYSMGGAVRATPVLANLNNDDKLEIVCATRNSIHVLTGLGEPLKHWPFVDDVMFVGAAVGDVDYDGAVEIAAVARVSESVSKVYLLEASGASYSVAWPVQIDGGTLAGPAIGNIDASGHMEIVVGTTDGAVLAIQTTGQVWTTVPDVTGSISSPPIIEDVDGNGKPDIVVSSKIYAPGGDPPVMRWTGYVTAIDRYGAIMPGWPQAAGWWTADVGPAPSPVALGIRREIMAGTPFDYLDCWQGSGERTASFPLNFGADIVTSAAAGQMDLDPWIEVVVATSAGSVYCRELRARSYPASALWWPMFGHDRARTHCYGFDVPTAVDERESAMPRATSIRSIHPNPFNPTTRIAFDLSEPSRVELSIYDVSGRRMAVLVDEMMEAGPHEAMWNGLTREGASAASGVYFCTLKAGGRIETKKLILLR